MKKLIVICIALVASFTLAYGNGIEWSATANWLNYANGTTRLDGNSSSTLGCFAQLLWVGANGVIDSAYNSGTGVGATDDLVIDKSWVGAGEASGADGWFTGSQLTEAGNVASGRVYFVRVWSGFASDYSAGAVPTSLTNKYGNSGLWTFNSIAPSFDTFDATLTADINTTLSPLAIPEPAMFGLGIVGLISLRFFGRKRK